MTRNTMKKILNRRNIRNFGMYKIYTTNNYRQCPCDQCKNLLSTPSTVSKSSDKITNTIIGIIGIIVLVFVTGLIVGCDREHNKAVDTFSNWTTKFGIEYLQYNCEPFDNDNNGYITCEYKEFRTKKIVIVECYSAYFGEGGCRPPKFTIPQHNDDLNDE